MGSNMVNTAFCKSFTTLTHIIVLNLLNRINLFLTSKNWLCYFKIVSSFEPTKDAFLIGMQQNFKSYSGTVWFNWTWCCDSTITTYQLLCTISVQVVHFEPILLTYRYPFNKSNFSILLQYHTNTIDQNYWSKYLFYNIV